MLSVKYVDRIGYRKSAGHRTRAGVFRPCDAGHAAERAACAVCGSCPCDDCERRGAGGLIEVIISPIVDSCPGDAKASAMSLLHSFYCWGQVGVVLITTLLLRLIGEDLWFIIPILMVFAAAL